MIKEALRWICEEYGTIRTIKDEITGVTYTKEEITPIIPPLPSSIYVQTLTGFSDYIIKKRDGLEKDDLLIVVEGHNEVSLVSKANPIHKTREKWISANCYDIITRGFGFGQQHTIPEFIISLQSHFKDTPDKKAILELVSNIRVDQSQEYHDTGYSQTVSARKSEGSSMVDQKPVPNPVVLAPFRTFLEIEQPESSFVFRLSGAGEGKPPTCALYEASGGAWKLDAIIKIRDWLESKNLGIAIIA